MSRVVSANLGRGVGADEFRANVRRIRRELAGAIICFQEIDEADQPDEHQILADVLGDRWAFAGWNSRTPIAVPKRLWEIVDDRLVLASPGVPRQTPARRHVTAKIQHRYRPDVELGVVDAHAPRRIPLLDAERAQWETSLRTTVHELVVAGLSTAVAMDRNGPQPPRLHPAQVVAARRRPDFVLWIPAKKGVQAEILDSDTVDLTIDAHDALASRLRFTAPPATVRPR